jgi:hypothetical protein
VVVYEKKEMQNLVTLSLQQIDSPKCLPYAEQFLRRILHFKGANQAKEKDHA